jgi:multiple antibiotic resistance protein
VLVKSDEKLSQKEIIRSQEEIEEMGIVPLAIPLLAGPGAISSSIIYSQRFTSVYSYIGAVVGLFLISILVLFVLSQGRRISDRMGRIGVNVMTRIMGLILMATSVEFVTRGLKIIFNLN